jgi:hypothetical protein
VLDTSAVILVGLNSSINSARLSMSDWLVKCEILPPPPSTSSDGLTKASQTALVSVLCAVAALGIGLYLGRCGGVTLFLGFCRRIVYLLAVGVVLGGCTIRKCTSTARGGSVDPSSEATPLAYESMGPRSPSTNIQTDDSKV